jgi:DNA uptake protein ComE-like DNA-binding protein
MQRYFPKLKKRYRLARIEYEQGSGGKLGIQVKLNPEGHFYDFAQNMLVKADDGDEAVKVNQIEMVPQTLTLSKGGQKRSDKVGKSMSAEYLAFNHPQGSETSSREQAALFSLLPTVGPGHSRYIRGHLLNANLGGKAEDRNLFPITHQANVDHKNKIENEAKRLVNQEGYLVRYQVKVNNINTGEDPNYAYVNADFDCELSTYGARQGKLTKSDKVKKASIKSRYTESKEAMVEGGTDTAKATKLQDFDKNQVKLASGLNVKYLTEMSATELRSIPGIGKESVRRLMQARSNGTIRNSKQLRDLIGTRQVNKLRDAGFELRLYRNEPAD